MAKNTDWSVSNEGMEMAVKLVDRYPEHFAHIDLGKINFISDNAGTGRKVCEVKACGFPYDIDSPYVYYFIMHSGGWKKLDEAQRHVAMMHMLYSVAENGTDEASANYGKCRSYDVKDYNLILNATGGRSDWAEPGAIGIVDPLAEGSSIGDGISSMETEGGDNSGIPSVNQMADADDTSMVAEEVF